jgi:hypothetical protein
MYSMYRYPPSMRPKPTQQRSPDTKKGENVSDNMFVGRSNTTLITTNIAGYKLNLTPT